MFTQPRQSAAPPRAPDTASNNEACPSPPSPPPPSSSPLADSSGSSRRCRRTSNGIRSGSSTSPFVLVCTTLSSMLATCGMLVMLPAGLDAQSDKYMSGAQWKNFLESGVGGDTWFTRWNAMVQPRIDKLAALAETERNWGDASSSGGRGTQQPFRVAMIGDSTMMQQHGVICAFLAERAGSLFDAAGHQDECCIDTLPREPAEEGEDANDHGTPALDLHNHTVNGGRGVCFRRSFQKFLEPPEWESLGSPDAVYFGSGLHLLHMHVMEAERAQGWLTYERDLESAVETYRAAGGAGFRGQLQESLTIHAHFFSRMHAVSPRSTSVWVATGGSVDSVYQGLFREMVDAYRDGDVEVISKCEGKMSQLAAGVTGPEGYGVDAYCRLGLMDRNGSEVLNR
ncbi:unnamed protein product [Ectocarpus sp. CCAP 1310/34]|nr:unnamed protein product [Ectocarpus sp. CCAP 1310/34]